MAFTSPVEDTGRSVIVAKRGMGAIVPGNRNLNAVGGLIAPWNTEASSISSSRLPLRRVGNGRSNYPHR
jgi:hypothetical protein